MDEHKVMTLRHMVVWSRWTEKVPLWLVHGCAYVNVSAKESNKHLIFNWIQNIEIGLSGSFNNLGQKHLYSFYQWFQTPICKLKKYATARKTYRMVCKPPFLLVCQKSQMF